MLTIRPCSKYPVRSCTAMSTIKMISLRQSQENQKFGIFVWKDIKLGVVIAKLVVNHISYVGRQTQRGPIWILYENLVC